MEKQVRTDLKEKMVFVAGPRQVGKTTMARRIAGKAGLYLRIPRESGRVFRRKAATIPSEAGHPFRRESGHF
ncbi:MAG: hypothetical protein MUQ25_07060 [Candidatus Aminicenantes bacterium]|nr:hypothetical protein [Candidatus Aminicenantes bacterium]